MAQGTPNLPDPIIHGTISADPVELRELADAIVRGASIVNAEIEDLRRLIDAVQAHPNARLARIGVDGKPTIKDATMLEVRSGVVQVCDCESLGIGLSLRLTTRFAQDASFKQVSFAGVAGFDRASFAGHARFDYASFAGGAGFDRASFAGVARFDHASFAGYVRFSQASFGDTWFHGARFTGSADFVLVKFRKTAWFGRAVFTESAQFDWASFADDARFDEAIFAESANFSATSFAKTAVFWRASIEGAAWFDGANFAESAEFAAANFAKEAWFDKAIFAESPWFGGASFAGAAFFDARRMDLSTVHFGAHPSREDHDFNEPKSRLTVLRAQIRAALLRVRDRWRLFRTITFGWPFPRSLGQLSILNRISLLALILVPVIAGAWPAVRAVVNGYNHAISESRLMLDESAGKLNAALDADAARLAALGAADASLVLQEQAARLQTQAARLDEQFGSIAVERHHLPYTLALAFFAAAAITIAQLIYQSRVPDEIKKHDADGYIDLMHKRYPEGAPDRNDGLRKACDALKTIASKRKDRHENFVTHHGETVWIPPGTHIQWFTDPTKGEVAEEAKRARAAVVERDPARSAGPPDTPASDAAETRDEEQLSEEEAKQPAPLPPGCIPGAERARIAIEEGARAEYWMIGRRNLRWAWACAAFYAVGLLLLAAILILQGWKVGHAAEWW